MATVVLTVVGTVLGGPIGGAIGAAVGQVIDSTVLFAPKGREGPRLSDLRLQTSRYGDQIPKIFGRMRVAGSVIWSTDLRERRSKKKGGKGQPSVTSYSYSASFAVALSSRRVAGVGRIWADGNLLRGSAGDFKTAVGAFRLHDGGEDQAVDPLIVADRGVNQTPAHRGIAYAVFEDMQLADYGNRIPSLTFELIGDAGDMSLDRIASEVSDGAIFSDAAAGLPVVKGYAAGGSDVAAALSPLVDGLGIALRTGEDGLRLVRSGGVSEGSIPHQLTGAAFNGKEERGLRIIRTRAEDVPVRLSVRYYDPLRDYQAGVQSAERSGPGRKQADLELPAVLEAGEARALAEGQLQRLWAGRSGIELRCDWRALTIEPGAVVTVEAQSGRWRIERSEWEGIGVRLTLRQVGGGGVVAPPASAGEGVAQIDGVHGPTALMVADLPPPVDDASVAPVVVVAAAGTEPGWRAAEIFVEDTATGGLASIGGSAAPATMGVLVAAPLASASPHLFDLGSMIEVDLMSGAMDLTGADDTALLRGENSALIGREVIQFGRASQIGPVRWRLDRLLRGRRGTEWAMADHASGERFLLLEEDSLLQVPGGYVQSGAALRINAIGIGDLTPAQAEEMVLGQAVTPLSPAQLKAVAQADDWQFSWVRRSRAGWRWSDGVDVPLAEENERYRINLIHSGAIFRTAEVGAQEWIWSAGDIAADARSGVITAEVRQIGTSGAGRPASIDIIL
jgi:hypothetical protein